MLFNIATLAASVLLLASTSSAGPAPHGKTVQIKSASNFCFMLPPSPGGLIAPNEQVAIAFCTQPDADAPGAKIFPEGFIRSAHFSKGEGYIQVTGQMDPSKYSLDPTDGGGQNDMKAPVGAYCANAGRFVSLVEPSSGIYCIRCCDKDDKKLCNTGKSTYGCKHVLGGEYGPNSGEQTTAPVPTSAPATATGTDSASATASATVPVSSGVVASSSAIVPTSATTTTTAGTTDPTTTPNAAVTYSQASSYISVAAAGLAAMLAL